MSQAVDCLPHKSEAQSSKHQYCTGGVAQEVEYLLCNPEALSSNPNPTKKKSNVKPQYCPKKKCQIMLKPLEVTEDDFCLENYELL
jgi:hypothetical protein